MEALAGTVMLGGQMTSPGTTIFNNSNITANNVYTGTDSQYKNFGNTTFNNCAFTLCYDPAGSDYISAARFFPNYLTALTGQRLTFNHCSYALTDAAKLLSERCLVLIEGADIHTNDNRMVFHGCTLGAGFTNLTKSDAAGGCLFIDDMTINTSSTTQATSAIKIKNVLAVTFKLVVTNALFTGNRLYYNAGNKGGNVIQFGTVTANNLTNWHLEYGAGGSEEVCALAAGHTYRFESTKATPPTTAYNGFADWTCKVGSDIYLCTDSGFADFDAAVWVKQ